MVNGGVVLGHPPDLGRLAVPDVEDLGVPPLGAGPVPGGDLRASKDDHVVVVAHDVVDLRRRLGRLALAHLLLPPTCQTTSSGLLEGGPVPVGHAAEQQPDLSADLADQPLVQNLRYCPLLLPGITPLE
jgi:hypothetical protein